MTERPIAQPVHEPYYVPEQGWFPVAAVVALALVMGGLGGLLNGLKADEGPGLTPLVMVAGLGLLAVVLGMWFAATIRENQVDGLVSSQLRRSYVLGMQWFIFSEVMFFLAFFGALFYVRVFAGPWLGGEGSKGVSNMLWQGFAFEWPMLQTPQEAVNSAGPGQYSAVDGIYTGADESLAFPGWQRLLGWLPLWNTIVLLSSSYTVHIAHQALKAGRRTQLTVWLGITVLLGIIFLFLQAEEYLEAVRDMGLTLQSGIYGSTFFILTGFHGFHVFMGATILLVMWLRATTRGHFSAEDHFGFEAASWYWHFVDVVWVGLFLFVYIL